MKKILLSFVVAFTGFTSVASLACDCGKSCSKKHESICTEKGLKKGTALYDSCIKEQEESCGEHGKCKKGANGSCH